MRRLHCLVLSALLVTAACASSRPHNSFELTVNDDGGIEIELSRDVLVGLLEDGLDGTIQCGGGADDELRALLAPLARKRNATNSIVDDAERITAARRGSRLRLTVAEAGAKRLEVVVPWSFGECILGRDITVSDALGRAPVTVVYTTDDGKQVKASVR